MKPADVKSSTHINSSKEISNRDPKSKIGDIVGVSKYKTFLQKSLFQIGRKKFSRLTKLKTLCRGHMLLVFLKAKKLLERSAKKNCKKKKKKKKRNLELKK